MDYAARFGEAVSELTRLLDSGELKGRETVLSGFERLPDALIGLFRGDNLGKQLVAVKP